jgi:hypothetical protein
MWLLAAAAAVIIIISTYIKILIIVVELCIVKLLIKIFQDNYVHGRKMVP